MKNLSNILNTLKEELLGLVGMMQVSERINSQRCVAKDLDTTKTIIEHKENEELTQEELNKVGKEISTIAKDLKGLSSVILTSERINSQRCVAKDLDTTETIIDQSARKEEFTEEEINNLANEAKNLVNTLLVSERINSQRCVAKDLDTTKTIIDHKETVNKKELETIISELKGILSEMLVSERINSQRCVAQSLDTSKTIIDHDNNK